MIAARRLVAPAVALMVIGVVATTKGPTSDTTITDVGLYRDYARAWEGGATPYDEIALEYPPLALVAFRVAALAGTSDHAYPITFGLLMLACLLAVMVLCAALAGERGVQAAWVVALSPLLTGALIRTHFDLVAVLFGLAGILALVRERPALAFTLLGLGTMTKVFPAVLVPVAIAWLLGQDRLRDALRGVAAFGAVVVIVSLPFAGNGYFDAYRFHLDRPLQVESTPAVIVLALGAGEVTGVGTDISNRFRSNGIRVAGAEMIGAAGLVLMVAAIAAFAWLAGRDPTQASLLLGCAGALLAFVALGKILSPQFMIWLVPIVAVAWARGARVLAGLCAAAMVLTQFEFPSRYFDLVALKPRVVALVTVRDLLLVTALCLCLWQASGWVRWRRHAAAATP